MYKCATQRELKRKSLAGYIIIKLNIKELFQILLEFDETATPLFGGAELRS